MGGDWRIFALGSAVFAALTAVFAKVGVSDIDSDLATAIRTAIVLLLALAIVVLRHEWPPAARLTPRTLLFLALSGLATGASWLCYFKALKLGPASRVAPIDKLSVVFVVLLAALFLGERLTWRAALGSSLIALGAILLAV